MWTTAASLDMKDVDAKWLQVYILKHGLGPWPVFVAVVEQKFRAYDYRQVVQDLLVLRQEGSVEYTKELEAAQYLVSMFNSECDDMCFTSHFVNGLKDIKGVVQSQMP
jgi:hypothetical protein